MGVRLGAMADQVTASERVGAPPARCHEVALDVERYPEWAADLVSASVLEHDDEGRPLRVAFRASGFGYSTSYTLAYDHGGAPERLAWVLVEGDVMRRLDGEYHFIASDGGTEVTYALAVELVVWLPGFVKRRVEARIVTTALDELKRRCEAG